MKTLGAFMALCVLVGSIRADVTQDEDQFNLQNTSDQVSSEIPENIKDIIHQTDIVNEFIDKMVAESDVEDFVIADTLEEDSDYATNIDNEKMQPYGILSYNTVDQENVNLSAVNEEKSPQIVNNLVQTVPESQSSAINLLDDNESVSGADEIEPIVGIMPVDEEGDEIVAEVPTYYDLQDAQIEDYFTEADTSNIIMLSFLDSHVSLSVGIHSTICDGTIIDHRHIITSARCVHNNHGSVMEPSNLRISAGEFIMPNGDQFLQIRVPSRIFIHHHYRFPHLEHDIAVVRVGRAFDVSFPTVGIAVRSPVPPQSQHNCIRPGWPRHPNDGSNLSQRNLTVLSAQECHDKMTTNYIWIPNTFCSFFPDVSSHFSESGAGVICNGQLTAVNVLTMGGTGMETSEVQFNIVVSFYNDWINEMLTHQQSSSSSSFINFLLFYMVFSLSIVFLILLVRVCIPYVRDRMDKPKPASKMQQQEFCTQEKSIV